MPVDEVAPPAPDEAAVIAAAVAEAVPLQDDMPPLWPDDSAEAQFLGEAKARGEPVVAVAAVAEEAPEKGAPLPALHELVNRIPAEAREALEDLFRAKFVSVRRVPAKALK